MRLPQGFRYRSSWEEFKTVIDFIKELLDKNEARIIYNNEDKVLLEMEEEKYADLPLEEDTFLRIVNAEFIALLQKGLKDSWETNSLRKHLRTIESDKPYDDMEIEEIVSMAERKYQYVIEKIVTREEINRFYFKQGTISSNLAEVQYNINKYIIDDKNDVKYALLKMISKKSTIEGNKNNIKEIEFVCDIKDIEHLIDDLKEIREKLQ